jgi:threonine dehydrogenase-like Zn-dependent dehydrogenase
MAIKLSDNQVFVLREKGHFYYETRPVPTLPSENQVTVAVGATGLCGSDVCTVKSPPPNSLQSRLLAFPLTLERT